MLVTYHFYLHPFLFKSRFNKRKTLDSPHFAYLLSAGTRPPALRNFLTNEKHFDVLSFAHRLSAGTPPPARSAHAAAAYQQRYLLIFGGGSVANCFGDLYVLDTESMHWSCPATQGPPPAPRAGQPMQLCTSTATASLVM